MAAIRSVVVAMAVMLAAGACQLGGGDEGDGSGDKGERVERGAAAGAAPSEKDLGSRETAVGGAGNAKVRVTLTSLARRDKLVTLNFTATVLQGDSWQISTFFSNDSYADDISGVYLIDPKNKKRHPAATDSNKKCVCTNNLSGTFVDLNQTVVFNGTFAAPPDEVEAVDVSIPRAGIFRNVPISD